MYLDDIIGVIKKNADECGIDPILALAVAMQESSLHPMAMRFEPHWQYFRDPAERKATAQNLKISEETEKQLEAFSWGVMQIMGSNARSLGWAFPLPSLLVPELGSRLGCQLLASYVKKYPKLEDHISAYNAGSPRKNIMGEYVNQEYVNSVLEKMKSLKV